MNIISKFILSPKEIETIAREITSQGLEIHDLDDASEYLSTTVFYKGPTLVISVNIPRLLPTRYRKVIIEPMPLNNKIVKLLHKTVFTNENETLAVISKCREDSRVTICERKQLKDISNDPCEAPLLREEHGQCSLSEHFLSAETRMITPGMLLVITVHQDVTINSTCGISTKTLSGIHLVTFHNCSVYVENELYQNFEIQFYHPTIIPLQLTKIKTLQIDRHVNVSELHELQLQNRQYLETMEQKQQLGLVSISIAITSIIALLAFGAFKVRRILSSTNCSGRAILMGEAVNDQAASAPTIANTDTCKSAKATNGYKASNVINVQTRPAAASRNWLAPSSASSPSSSSPSSSSSSPSPPIMLGSAILGKG